MQRLSQRSRKDGSAMVFIGSGADAEETSIGPVSFESLLTGDRTTSTRPG
jgi:hypothetical protein